jgi:hypothetical protein
MIKVFIKKFQNPCKKYKSYIVENYNNFKIKNDENGNSITTKIKVSLIILEKNGSIILTRKERFLFF